MPLRRGVKWHDGQPFTAKDVECTWDLLTGSGNDKLRINPRKSWYDNLDAVTANGDFEVTFRLKRPQPSFLTLLASGWSPVYPCHVPARDMRQHPIGTGPFKFVEFKPNSVDHARPQPRLLETGQALSRRHRMDDRQGYLDAALELLRRPSRRLFRRHLPAAPGRQERGAGRGLRRFPGEWQPQPDRQSRRAALRQPRSQARDVVDLGPSGVHRHHGPGDRARSAAQWSRRPRDCGACRPRC